MTSLVEKVTTRLLAIPRREPIPHPFLGARTQSVVLLVQVQATSGATGLGCLAVESTRFASALELIVQGVGESLIGQACDNRDALHRRMWGLTADLLHEGASNLAMATIDIALWDLAGKEQGLPLWKMLGGVARPVPAYASWTLWRHHDLGRLEHDAGEAVARGFRAVKMRVGNRPLAEDLQRARVVRDAVGPGVQVMADALWSCTPAQGVEMALALGDLGFAWLEEPVAEGDYTGLAEVRRAGALPIAAGERVSRTDQLQQLLPCVDHAILDVVHLGGITPWRAAARVLQEKGLPVSAHVLHQVQVHLLASLGQGGWLEYMPSLEPLFIDPPRPVQGVIVPPQRPGIGLELDEHAVRRFLLY